MTLLAHKLRFYGSCKKFFKYFRKSARGSAVSNNGGPIRLGVKADSAGLLFQARFSYMYFYEDNFIFISSGDHLDLDSMCFP